MSFVVKQQSFEGPLDLLLSLIEKRKLFINDISLSKVADDFIEHIKRFEHFPLEDSAHFILVASTLLLIKSKSLLPNLALTAEEEGNIGDLELRLKVYQRIKEAGILVKNRFGREIIFAKSTTRPIVPVFSPDPGMTLGTIAAEIEKTPMERTALILVGKVLGAATFRDSALYDAGYQRRFRGRGT